MDVGTILSLHGRLIVAPTDSIDSFLNFAIRSFCLFDAMIFAFSTEHMEYNGVIPGEKGKEHGSSAQPHCGSDSDNAINGASASGSCRRLR